MRALKGAELRIEFVLANMTTPGSGFALRQWIRAEKLPVRSAAVGTVVFGLFSKVGDYRVALLRAGCLFLPATLIALWLPELPVLEAETVEVVPLAD